MKILTLALSAALLAAPLLASGAEARSATAAQISAAGHGRRPVLSNRPSREIYRRQGHARHYGYRHMRRHRY